MRSCGRHVQDLLLKFLSMEKGFFTSRRVIWNKYFVISFSISPLKQKPLINFFCFLVLHQLEESTNQELNHQISHFDLPPKILCRVVNIRLLAEKDSDEVYAQITLYPEADVCIYFYFLALILLLFLFLLSHPSTHPTIPFSETS
ncbi:hypothetical protein IC575_030172 [Cucumis melo]